MWHRSSVQQSGAVSLFVVVFAALLMTIVTIGFIQIMTKDQEQATANDLSQSAYDSAQAGVEDAKRLLLAEKACGVSLDATCQTYRNAIAAGECTTIADAGMGGDPGAPETMLESAEGDDALDQAYTCVKISKLTNDYRSTLALHESAIIPLVGTGEFNRIEVQWFESEDAGTGVTNLTFPDSGAAELPPLGSRWPKTTPPLLRAQLMQVGTGFDLGNFDTTTSDGKSNANTLFLYPTNLLVPSGSSVDFARDGRRSGSLTPVATGCAQNFASTVKYACSMTINLPEPVNGTKSDREAYLRLSALYNATSYSVKLYNDSSLVQMNGTQPEVDSTGRANNLFRRVQARVELRGEMTYPEAAVDIAGNLCKKFFITDDRNQYAPQGCTP